MNNFRRFKKNFRWLCCIFAPMNGNGKLGKVGGSGWIAHVVALCVIMIWGGTFVNTRVLIDKGLLPEEIFVLRTVVAYFCIWFISPKKVFSNSVICTAPLITLILALFFFKSVKASVPVVVGSLLALVGVGIVIFNGHFVLHLDPLGDLLALAAAVSWAIYSLVMKNFSTRYSSVFITRKVFFYGLITIMPVFLAHPWSFDFKALLTPSIGLNLLYLSVIASFVCFAAWGWVISQLGALRASNYIYFNPVTTVIMSALILNEHMTIIAFMGSAMILSGVFISNKAKNVG